MRRFEKLEAEGTPNGLDMNICLTSLGHGYMRFKLVSPVPIRTNLDAPLLKQISNKEKKHEAGLNAIAPYQVLCRLTLG